MNQSLGGTEVHDLWSDAVGDTFRVFIETDAGRRLEGKDLPDDHPAKPPPIHLDMVDDMRRFVAQLQSRSHVDFKVASIEIADEFHATVPAIVLNRALRHFHR